MLVASLVLAVITFIIALLIHAETRETLGRMYAITDTLPSAHDVKRLIKDIENSKAYRGKVICDAPKNTHIAYSPPGSEIPWIIRGKNKFWRCVRWCASFISGDIYEPMVEEPISGKWEIKSDHIGSPDLETLLTQGWEPFSVTSDNDVWLRRHRNVSN